MAIMERALDGIGALLFGILSGGLGYYYWWQITQLETTGGNIRVHSLIKLAYDIGGKNGIVVLFALLSLGGVVRWIYRIFKK